MKEIVNDILDGGGLVVTDEELMDASLKQNGYPKGLGTRVAADSAPLRHVWMCYSFTRGGEKVLAEVYSTMSRAKDWVERVRGTNGRWKSGAPTVLTYEQEFGGQWRITASVEEMTVKES